MKNSDRGLENAARGCRPRAAFSRPRSQFFTIRIDPKPVNNFFFFFLRIKNCFNFCKHKDQISRKRYRKGGRFTGMLCALIERGSKNISLIIGDTLEMKYP